MLVGAMVIAFEGIVIVGLGEEEFEVIVGFFLQQEGGHAVPSGRALFAVGGQPFRGRLVALIAAAGGRGGALLLLGFSGGEICWFWDWSWSCRC